MGAQTKVKSDVVLVFEGFSQQLQENKFQKL
jgi:hypothetical protein